MKLVSPNKGIKIQQFRDDMTQSVSHLLIRPRQRAQGDAP